MEQEHCPINRSALFSDETENFRTPVECDPGDRVRIRMRTAKDNISQVTVRSLGKEYPMTKIKTEGRFDYYEADLLCGRELLLYDFKIVSADGKEVCYFDRQGVWEQPDGKAAFEIIPGFHAPQWPRGKVFYQIFVDRFYNGDPSNDVLDHEYNYIDGLHAEKVKDWYAYPASKDVQRFYGGDLQGVIDKLDYLQYLGVEVLYLNPIFVSPSNHKYDTQDYSAVDPHFGRIVVDEGEVLAKGEKDNQKASRYICRTTRKENLDASNALLIRLIEEAHARGIRIILDGVFNHCGSFHKWMDREKIYRNQKEYVAGAYLEAESPYREYFSFKKEDWPDNDTYEGWWNLDTLPKLNYDECEALQEEILEIGVKWVSPPYNADGWRLDVAADLGHSEVFNHTFWKRFRERIKAVSPEKLILAEHYGDGSAWLQGNEWDTFMNYDGFMEPVTWFLTGMEKHSERLEPGMLNNGVAFFHTMMKNLSKLQVGSALSAMNELSNHDHSRFLTRTNRTAGRTETLGPEAAERGVDKAVLREAVVIQMTWPGAPTIYYGDEAGLCGFTDPDSRRTYPWGREDFELMEFHRYMISIHKKNPALICGSVKPLLAGDGLIAYGRFRGENQLVIVVNNGTDRSVRIPVWEIGIEEGGVMERLMETGSYGYNVGRVEEPVRDGFLEIRLKSKTAAVYRRKIR